MSEPKRFTRDLNPEEAEKYLQEGQNFFEGMKEPLEKQTILDNLDIGLFRAAVDTEGRLGIWLSKAGIKLMNSIPKDDPKRLEKITKKIRELNGSTPCNIHGFLYLDNEGCRQCREDKIFTE